MRIRSLSRRSKMLVFGLALLGVLSVGFGLSLKAGALGNLYFPYGNNAACDVDPCSTQVRLMTFETSHAQGGRENLTAYFTSRNGQLVILGANFCPSQSGNPDKIESGNYYYDNPSELANGTEITQYVISYPGHSYTVYGKYYRNPVAACSDDITINLPEMALDNDTKLFTAKISATGLNKKPGPCKSGVDTSACDGIVNFFRIQAAGGNAFAVAQNGDKSEKSGNQVTIDSVEPASTYATYNIKFGSDCSVDGSSDYELTYYDMDNDPGGSAQPGPGPRVTMSLYDATTGQKLDSWTPPNNNDAVGSHVLSKPKKNQKFIWKIENVRASNTVQFGTPFDGVYALVDCDTAPPPPPIQPYFQTTGGDVVAGASFATGNGATAVPCSAAPHVATAGVTSWNKGGSPSFAGAGDEYATYALGIIQDFVTGQGTGQKPAGQGVNDLTFANKNVSGSVNVSAGTFGGIFGSAPCVDYWETKPVLSSLPNYGGGSISSADGVYAHTGNLTINGGTIPTGKHVTIYVDGDVAITGDIKYANATWTNRRQIPSFKLVVHGSIFINSNVKELNGTYAAIPDNGATTKSNSYGNPIAGTITTCSSGFSSYNPPADGNASPIDDLCGNPLTINGSVAAHQLWLLRANGSLASNTPAEVINYTPETWLSIDPSRVIAPDPDYQSIIGLPPVL